MCSVPGSSGHGFVGPAIHIVHIDTDTLLQADTYILEDE